MFVSFTYLTPSVPTTTYLLLHIRRSSDRFCGRLHGEFYWLVSDVSGSSADSLTLATGQSCSALWTDVGGGEDSFSLSNMFLTVLCLGERQQLLLHHEVQHEGSTQLMYWRTGPAEGHSERGSAVQTWRRLHPVFQEQVSIETVVLQWWRTETIAPSVCAALLQCNLPHLLAAHDKMVKWGCDGWIHGVNCKRSLWWCSEVCFNQWNFTVNSMCCTWIKWCHVLVVNMTDLIFRGFRLSFI